MSQIASETVGSNQAPVDTSSVGDQGSSFSFSSLHDQALAAMEPGTPAATPEHVAASVLAEKPVAEAATNVDNASAATLAQLKPTDLVEVEVDGQPVQMPWSEARGGVMRQAKFTKEMTALRREQETFEASRAGLVTAQQQREMLVGLLNNKEMLRHFLTQKHPDLLAQAAAVEAAATHVDPDDIATVGQIAEARRASEARLTEIAEQFEQNLLKQADVIGQQIEDKQATLRLGSDIRSTIDEMFTAHPYLKQVIPNTEQVLRWTVSEMKPRTEAETIQAFKDVVGGWVENFKSVQADTSKTAVIAKQKLATHGIQPPGGSGVQPQPTTYKKTNALTGKSEIDWSVLRSAAESMLS